MSVGHAGQIRVGEDAGLEKLEGESHRLRRGERVDAVLGGLLRDLEAEIEVGEGRHRVSELGEALHHVRSRRRVTEIAAPHFMGQLWQLSSRVRTFSWSRPLLLDLVGPEFLAAGAGVAPDEVLGVPLLVVQLHLLRRAEPGQDRHHARNRVLLADLDELRAPRCRAR